MKVALFDSKKYEKEYYLNEKSIHFDFFDFPLNKHTANACESYEVICCFVNDILDEDCLQKLSQLGVKLICLRCAGYNNVDLVAAEKLNIAICRVPSYSPQSVAEFTLSQVLCLTRKLHRSYQRTKDLNFSLHGLVGTTLRNKTIGVLGTGQIGTSFIELLDGFHCKVLAYDLNPNHSLTQGRDLKYSSLEKVLSDSDIISLHIPLSPETRHIINTESISTMKDGALIVNTGRGGLIETKSLITGLKQKKIGGAALDVYEEEENYFFSNFSNEGIDDDDLSRLVTFPNVIVSSHQAYLTDTSLMEISSTTLDNILSWKSGCLINQVKR